MIYSRLLLQIIITRLAFISTFIIKGNCKDASLIVFLRVKIRMLSKKRFYCQY